MSEAAGSIDGPSERGGFFVIDRRCIERTCQIADGLNLGLAHLVLARFASGRNHSSTRAGMTAIHARLGLSRGRADALLAGLERAGIVSRPGRGGIRRLMSWADMEAETAGLSVRQRAVLARVKSRKAPILSSADPDYQVAYALKEKGALVLTKAAGKPKFAVPEPEYLFLPNTLVDGFQQGDAPLARLRQTERRQALETLMRVYQHANLPEDGGLPVAAFRQSFHRVEAAQWGRFTVWAFARDGQTAALDPLVTPFVGASKGEIRDARVQDFWDVWQMLIDARLVERVTYVFEGPSDTSQPLHAYPILGGTKEERSVFEAGHGAAAAMVSDAQITRAAALLGADQIYLCPVLSHVVGAQLVGIARPVHRANTSRTRAWAANFIHQCTGHAEVFKIAAQSARRSIA